MVTLPSCGPSITTPMSRNACKVARLSSPSKNPSTWVVPSAIEPNMIERCEMDLSPGTRKVPLRSEEHTSELQSRPHLVCRLLLEKKKTDDQHRAGTAL